MHTHFGSGTHLLSVFLGVVLAGTLWRLSWQAIARAALFQY